MTGREIIQALRQGRYVYSSAMVSTSPLWPALARHAGIDFVFVDTEHVPLDRTQPYEQPVPSVDEMVYRLNPALLHWAYALTRNTKLVDNAWSAPEATGCGGIFAFAVDPIIDGSVGVPAKAGVNTAELINTIATATAHSVNAH